MIEPTRLSRHRQWPWFFTLLLFRCLATAADAGAAPADTGGLTFKSSDTRLAQAFAWAKQQALSYAHRGDPVGSWYEAALPGREAFCMRDTAHQAMGAHALGLQEHNRNMLRKFAANVSRSKDWCSYWEINRHDQPAPVDYQSDRDFWYNLSANFDVVSACYRMFLWTHDRTYLEDPAFVEFYRRTCTDFVNHWKLGVDQVSTRERFMHQDSPSGRGRFGASRGIPSYHEGRPGQTRVGVDLLAFQAAAFRGYARMLSVSGESDASRAFAAKAAEVTRCIEERFWDNTAQGFNELLLTDGTFITEGDMRIYLLYNDALATPDRIALTLDSIVKRTSVNIEMGSHCPEVLFRYGAHETAVRRLLDLADPRTPRREYPEVSFAAIGALVQGLMGVEPSENEHAVASQSRLVESIAWAEIDGLGVHGQLLGLRHNGTSESVLVNHSRQPIAWTARFAGTARKLEVGGSLVPAQTAKDIAGREFAWVQTTVNPGESVTVRRLVTRE